MERVLSGLNPERVFYYFEEITKIPHGSKNEKQISDYLLNLSIEKGWEVIQDEALNIIIRKPATKGYENAPIVLLQGHMDMVCEKNEGVEHDFEKDPLKLRIKDGHLYATGTTLGADNGIAVAMILAIYEDETLEHPPLEALITVDEEMGMTGVDKLDGDMITAKHLINLDCEPEGVLTAGCAGGAEVTFKVPVRKVKSEKSNTVAVKVTGLVGGHSGADAHTERGYSTKIIGRVLRNVLEETELVSIVAGSKPNAIPREAKAVIKTNDIEALKTKIAAINEILKNEYSFTDAGVTVLVEKESEVDEVMTKEIYKKTVACINLIPVGALSRSTVIDLVISSNNLGVITMDDNYIMMNCHPRSSVMSLLKEDFVPNMVTLAESLGIECEIGGYYPGWEYAKESKIRDLCAQTYKDITGVDAKIEAIHAGLECGFLMEKCKTLADAISFGPNMAYIHTPDEHLDIASTERVYNYLCEVLKRIK